MNTTTTSKFALPYVGHQLIVGWTLPNRDFLFGVLDNASAHARTVFREFRSLHTVLLVEGRNANIESGSE